MLFPVRYEVWRETLIPAHKIKAAFIKPMLLLPTNALPDGEEWSYELKVDGYRAEAIKTDGKVQLRSRHNKDFNIRFPGIGKALTPLPDESRVDEPAPSNFALN